MSYLDGVFDLLMQDEQSQHDELEQLYAVLRKASTVLTGDEFSLLCYECGIDKEDVSSP